ncbi:MAG: hypothetical protein FJ298_08140, partial [Planctomycetes bacterium]|nr:hypothetical protein [Planctomycetota bacterium]
MKRTLIVVFALAALAGAWWVLRERPAAPPEAPKVAVEPSNDASTLAPPAVEEPTPQAPASAPPLESAPELEASGPEVLWTLRGAVVRAG